MKSKILTKLQDWNENAQARRRVKIFMLFCAAQKRMILLNKIIFLK